MVVLGLRNLAGAVYRRKFVRIGVPFVIFVVGGSFGLKHFTSLRYELTSVSQITPEEASKAGVKMKPRGSVTLESVYEEVEKLNVDNWENVRGPRPWEEGNEFNKILEERRKAAEERLKERDHAVKTTRGTFSP